jgi:hypothetical protein
MGSACIVNAGLVKAVGECVAGADPNALNVFQITEPSRTQREGEAPAELAVLRLRRSVALPTDELIGLIRCEHVESDGVTPGVDHRDPSNPCDRHAIETAHRR